MRAPRVIDRLDLNHGTVFVVTCDAGFDRKIGSMVLLQGGWWEILGWDDHRLAGGPCNGENIAIKVLALSLEDKFTDLLEEAFRAAGGGRQPIEALLRQYAEATALQVGHRWPYPSDEDGDDPSPDAKLQWLVACHHFRTCLRHADGSMGRIGISPGGLLAVLEEARNIGRGEGLFPTDLENLTVLALARGAAYRSQASKSGEARREC